MRWAALASLVALSWALPIAAQSTVDHTAWDLLLKRHVASGLVDYEGLRQDRATLDRYVVSLQDVQPSQLGSRQAQLAFWINAYNANVVKGVLDHYRPAPSKARLPVPSLPAPQSRQAGQTGRQTGQAGPIASVKEVKGFFDRLRYRVAGRELTLNEIEGEGRALGDWRIHFAVVCASSSCPLLRAEAYVADRLESQLAEQTRQFLEDPQRGIRVEGTTLWVSKIFDWYATDFVSAKELGLFRRLPSEKLLAVLSPYLKPELAQAAKHRRSELKFLDYDWSLNAQRP